MNLEKALETLFQHHETVRQLERELFSCDDVPRLIKTLSTTTETLLDRSDDTATARLEVLAELWGHIDDDRAVQTLVTILGHPSDAVRRAAGGALIEVAEPGADDAGGDQAAYERFARIVRSSLESRNDFGPEVEELAVIISELESPAVVDLLLIMMHHRSPRVVAAGLSVAGEMAWHDEVRTAIEKLTSDSRSVTLIDEDEGEVSLSIAELASEIEAALRSLK